MRTASRSVHRFSLSSGTMWLMSRVTGELCPANGTDLKKHSDRRKLSAFWAPPVDRKLRRDVHFVEVSGTGKPTEPHKDLAAWPAARDDGTGGERRLAFVGHSPSLPPGRTLPARIQNAEGNHSSRSFAHSARNGTRRVVDTQ